MMGEAANIKAIVQNDPNLTNAEIDAAHDEIDADLKKVKASLTAFEEHGKLRAAA